MNTTEAQDEAAQKAAQSLQDENIKADADTLRLLFTEARTHYGWQNKAVPEETIRTLYDLMKMGPTSMNQQPARLLLIRSQEAKDRLIPHLMEGNKAKVQAAPITVILAQDQKFYEKLPKTFPANPKAQDIFKDNTPLAEINAFRNGTLQGAYLMLAARAVGLDVGPMSGFDNAKVDAEFFNSTSLKSNFLINIGYADTSKIFRRLPRLEFDEVCTFI